VALAQAVEFDRAAALAWFDKNRARSRLIFDVIDPAAYYTRPIALRNPIVFYEGHLPAFNVNTLIKRGLGEPGVDDALEYLFARGIDPDQAEHARPRVDAGWPSRDAVLDYAARADERLRAALSGAPVSQRGRPVLDSAEGVYAILEHEAMHQETLLYMWHRLPLDQKTRPDGGAPVVDGRPPKRRRVEVPAGQARLGAERGEIPFGWDNEFRSTVVHVPAFEVDVYNVTNQDFLAFVDDGGYHREELWDEVGWAWREESRAEHPIFWEREDGAWFWRGQFERVALPAAWPVYVSWAEATAFARWSGARLMSEPEFHRAAYGTPEGVDRVHPWGDSPPDSSRGNFDFAHWDPVPVGSFADGASAWGVHDLVGNGWEWTSSVFGPFPGFEPMASYPEYSADFFDGSHYVMKGASPVTPKELVRRSFRNWFRPTYPYVYATFRLAWDVA
jgi:iron(II)-dependent oxidoreductase